MEETVTTESFSESLVTSVHSAENGSAAAVTETKKKTTTKKKKKTTTTKTTKTSKTSLTRSVTDAEFLNKKIHVRSVDTAQVQMKFNRAAAENEAAKLCKLCNRQVFQMEQIKAEKAVWHKSCFKCHECSKQLNVDTYSSHEGVLYCKPHFKTLFQPKAVFDSDEPAPAKPALIVRESQPVELPPDVVRATERPDYGLEELSNLDVRSRFSVFERSGQDADHERRELSRSPSGLKRSESILLRMARFERKGTEGGMADLPADQLEIEDSSSEEEGDLVEDQVDANIVRASPKKRRERPQSFSSMGDVKSKWESGRHHQEGYMTRKEELAEERKEELQRIRAKLFAGRQVRMKEAYEQAVHEGQQSKDSPRVLDVPAEVKAKSIKEIFEKGVDETTPSKPKLQDEEIFEAATAKESRNIFKQLDENTRREELDNPLRRSQSQRIAASELRVEHRAPSRETSTEVVRASDKTDDVEVATADVASRFRFFETFRQKEEKRDTEKPKRILRDTPPRALDAQEQDGESNKELSDPEKEAAAQTTSKVLNLFRQLEQKAGREELPQGPKPLKRFTPPPEYTKESESEGEEDEEEDGEEEDGEEVEEEEEEVEEEKHTTKSAVEEELLQIAKERALAKNLRSKFEHWEDEIEKENRLNRKSPSPLLGSDEQVSLDTARNLRARFEALQQESSKPADKPRPKVHRFVEATAAGSEPCGACGKKVYAMEKMEVTKKTYHKNCFRCTLCSCVLRLDNFSLNNGRFYCSPHYKQLFITKGNYDEGFGSERVTRKWQPKSSSVDNDQPMSSPEPVQTPVQPLAVENQHESDEELFDKIADSNGHDSALEDHLFDE